jgi:murein DD-endopeptidase MepM/ murein hydrolase activator NlpD
MRGSRVLVRLVEWLRRHAETDRHSVTITIVPAQAERILQVELPRWALRLVGGVLAASVVLVIAGGVLYGFLIHDSLRLREVRKENAILHERSARLDAIEQEVAEIDHVRRKLYALAGVTEASASEDSRGSSVPDPATDQPVNASPSAVPPFTPQGALQSDVEGGSAERPASEPSVPLRVIPLEGPISQSFHRDGSEGPGHEGIDIAGSEGTPILAAAAGTVVFAGWDPTLGNLLVLDHGSGWRTRYGHNQKIVVETGERVMAGQHVALLGSTGQSSAPHLHFEVLSEGAPIDPTIALPLDPGHDHQGSRGSGSTVQRSGE